MTSVFEDHAPRADPTVPIAQTPLAAQDGGADDDSGGLGAQFFLTLGATLGSINDTMAADRADRMRRQSPPADNQLFAAGVAPSSGLITLDLGSVPLGFVWQVRRLICSGNPVTATAEGMAFAFSQGAPPADLSPTDCVDIFLQLPKGSTYGTHQLFLLGGEHLWVVFSGATEGQQYAASARVEQWEETTFRSTFAE